MSFPGLNCRQGQQTEGLVLFFWAYNRKVVAECVVATKSSHFYLWCVLLINNVLVLLSVSKALNAESTQTLIALFLVSRVCQHVTGCWNIARLEDWLTRAWRLSVLRSSGKLKFQQWCSSCSCQIEKFAQRPIRWNVGNMYQISQLWAQGLVNSSKTYYSAIVIEKKMFIHAQ